MKSKVMSCLVVLVAMSVITQMNAISVLSVLLIVFTLNSIVVSMIGRKHKQINLKNNSYYYLMITKVETFFAQISKYITNLMQNKLIIHLSKVDETLSKMSFCGNRLDIRSECKLVSRLITDNYIDFWYESIGTDNKDFVIDCRQILENIFVDLFDKCSQRLDRQEFWQKFLNLLENHLNAIKSGEDLSSVELNEKQRMESIIERVLRLTATQDMIYVIPKSSWKSKTLSIYLMIKAMLSHSVFIPIVDIIADKKFIYENLVYLIANSDLKFVDKVYHLKNKIDESFNLDFKEQFKSIDSIDCSRSQFYDQNIVRTQFSSDDNIQQNIDFTDNESNEELIEALEAEEEFDSKIISNLVISNTKEMKDMFGPSYVLYLIQYDGLFRQLVDIPDYTSADSQECCLVRNNISVYRRFSEFISLQKVLEKNKNFKHLMKGIQKPTAIQITTQNLLAFAGSSTQSLDASTIEYRKIYLQNFLNQLCHRKVILESKEFHQFLGYGSDGNIAFVNKSKNLLNIDKMFFKGIKGAISIMKSALPIEPQIGKIDPKFSERTIPETEKLTIKTIETRVDSESRMQLENKINCWLEKGFDEDSDELVEKIDEIDYKSELRLGARTLGDGCEDPNAMEFSERKPMNENEVDSSTSGDSLQKPKSQPKTQFSETTHSIDCFILLITDNIQIIKQIICVKIISFLFGKVVQSFIDQVLSKLVNKEVFVRYIHSLHSAIWPESKPEVQTELEVQRDEYLDLTVDAIYLSAKNRSLAVSPYVGQLLDRFSIRDLLSNGLSKLKNSETNKVFLYNFFELILDEIE